MILSSLVFTPAAAATTTSTPLIGEDVAVAVWSRAENRAACAPLALASNGGVPGSPRFADFSSGWGVAFDSARTRSAYGFAGTGLLPEDRKSDVAKRRSLAKQWPYTRDLGRTGKLPRGSFAGYGLEGGGRYARGNPRGLNQRSLAYVRIPGQSCLYNVWSSVSRAHLEQVLDNLRLVPRPETKAPERNAADFTRFVARLRVPATQKCTVGRDALPCRLRRDGEGVLEIRVGGREPLLVNVYPDSADLFAIVGRRNIPILTRYVPHPAAMNCLRAVERGSPIDQICVGVDAP